MFRNSGTTFGNNVADTFTIKNVVILTVRYLIKEDIPLVDGSYFRSVPKQNIGYAVGEGDVGMVVEHYTIWNW